MFVIKTTTMFGDVSFVEVASMLEARQLLAQLDIEATRYEVFGETKLPPAAADEVTCFNFYDFFHTDGEILSTLKRAFTDSFSQPASAQVSRKFEELTNGTLVFTWKSVAHTNPIESFEYTFTYNDVTQSTIGTYIGLAKNFKRGDIALLLSFSK